jgi:hypothetical protein
MTLPPAFLFWVAFVSALTSHAFIVAAFGAFSAYFIAERWQRWRQRREFQHRAMLDFAEASTAVMATLWNMARARAHGWTQYHGLVEVYPSKFEPLAARDAQFYAVFENKQLVHELAELTKLMNRIFVKITKITDTSSPVVIDPAIVRRGIDCLTARRRLILGQMAREMRLRTKADVKSLERELRPQATSVPPEFAS